MPDTEYNSGGSSSAATSWQLWDAWKQDRADLERLVTAEMLAINVLNEMRHREHFAEPLREIDATAVDRVGGLLDFISNVEGRHAKLHDEASAQFEEIDVRELRELHKQLKARSEARKV